MDDTQPQVDPNTTPADVPAEEETPQEPAAPDTTTPEPNEGDGGVM